MTKGHVQLAIVTICILGILAPANAQTDKDSGIPLSELPTAVKEKAELTFAQGYAYYIWYEGKEPILPEEALSAVVGTTFGISFKYLAKDAPPSSPYKVRIEAHVLNEDDKAVVLYSTTSDERSPKGQSGAEGGILIAKSTKLSGEGYAEVFLIEPKGKDSEARHLSNSVRVRLKADGQSVEGKK